MWRYKFNFLSALLMDCRSRWWIFMGRRTTHPLTAHPPTCFSGSGSVDLGAVNVNFEGKKGTQLELFHRFTQICFYKTTKLIANETFCLALKSDISFNFFLHFVMCYLSILTLSALGLGTLSCMKTQKLISTLKDGEGCDSDFYNTVAWFYRHREE